MWGLAPSQMPAVLPHFLLCPPRAPCPFSLVPSLCRPPLCWVTLLCTSTVHCIGPGCAVHSSLPASPSSFILTLNLLLGRPSQALWCLQEALSHLSEARRGHRLGLVLAGRGHPASVVPLVGAGMGLLQGSQVVPPPLGSCPESSVGHREMREKPESGCPADGTLLAM